MIKFACPGCQSNFSVGDDKAGKTGKCPKCQSQFVIPQLESAAPPPAPKPDPSIPVEITPCPGCGTVLTVATEHLGGAVECPNCQTEFTAERPKPKPKVKSQAVVSVPPPPPPPEPDPAAAFSGLGGGDDEDEAPKPKKKKGKPADDEEDFDDAPKKKKKGMSDVEEDDEDYEDAPRPKKKGNGLLLAAGIVHVIFGLIMLTCGGMNIFCSSMLSLGSSSKVAESTTTYKIDSKSSFERDMAKANQESVKRLKDLNTLSNVSIGVGIGTMIVAFVAITAGVFCFVRKPIAKLLTFAAGPGATFLSLISTLAPILIMGSDLPGSTYALAIGGAITFGYALYAGFTIYAVTKGFKNEAGGGKLKKKTTDVDDDAEDDFADEEPAPKKSKKKVVEEEEEDLPPPPKKSKKKVVEEEEEDLPPPPKKSKKKVVEEEEEDGFLPPSPPAGGGNAFAFDEDEEEAPKPKKKKPRRDDDE